MENDPLVWGAENIGRLIDRSERQVYHLARRQLIPVWKIGSQLVGRESVLRDPNKWPRKDDEAAA